MPLALFVPEHSPTKIGEPFSISHATFEAIKKS